MCRSKEHGGRRCAGRRKKNIEAEVSAATETAATETVVVEAPRLNPATPTLNHLLTVSPEEWLDTPWAKRKKVVETAFLETREATGTDVKWGGYNRRTKSLGITDWKRSWNGRIEPVIELSDVVLRQVTPLNVAVTIAHELAHARAGIYQGHNTKWRDIFTDLKADLGIEGEVTEVHTSNEVERAYALKLAEAKAAKPPVWLGLCPQGHRFGAGRKITNTYVCLKCDSSTYTQDERTITYTRNENKETL